MESAALKLSSYARGGKNSLLYVFCNIFVFRVFLSYFVVYGDDVHYCFIKYCI